MTRLLSFFFRPTDTKSEKTSRKSINKKILALAGQYRDASSYPITNQPTHSSWKSEVNFV